MSWHIIRSMEHWYRNRQQFPGLAVAYFASTHGVSPDSVSVPEITTLVNSEKCYQWYEANVSAIR